MNTKVLAVFGVVLVVVLGFPFYVGMLQSARPAAQAAPPSPTSAAPPVAPVPAPPPEQTMAPPADQTPPPPAFQYNAQTLTNTSWMMNTQQGQVEVQLLPGGRALASHPMVGQIEATWRVAGNRVSVNANVFGQAYNLACDIQGDTLTYQGTPIQRLR